jgi:hypothetical protein
MNLLLKTIGVCAVVFANTVIAQVSGENVQRRLESGVESIGGSTFPVGMACRPGSVTGSVMSQQQLNNELQKALRTAEIDSSGRLRKMTYLGREVEPVYSGDRLVGMLKDGVYSEITADAGSSSREPTSVFFRDNAGELKAAIQIQKRVLGNVQLEQETGMTYENAMIDLRQQVLASEKKTRLKFGGDWDYLIKPCFVCDMEFTIDTGRCSMVASLAAAADALLVAGVCGVSAGVACAPATVVGIVGLAAIWTWYEECMVGARGRYMSCRSSC